MSDKKIGEFISKMRKERNLTQEQLANKLNVSYKTISKWECGGSIPDINMLNRISKVLGIKIGELLECELKKKKFIVNKKVIYLIVIIFLVVTNFLCLFILKNNYNNIFIYKLSSLDSLYRVDGMLVRTPSKEFLKINSISVNNILYDEKIKAYDYSYQLFCDDTHLLGYGDLGLFEYDNNSKLINLNEMLREINIDVLENKNYDEIIVDKIYNNDLILKVWYLDENMNIQNIDIKIMLEAKFKNNRFIYDGGNSF